MSFIYDNKQSSKRLEYKWMSVKCFDQPERMKKSERTSTRDEKNEKNKNCFEIHFSLRSLISNESEIKFIFYLLFRWWFLPYTRINSIYIVPLLNNERREWTSCRAEKTCCLLLLSEILFVSWCQTFSYTFHIIQQKISTNAKTALICRFVFRSWEWVSLA